MNAAQRRRRRKRREEARLARRLANKGSILEFEENFSVENLLAAAYDCRAGVRWKASVQRFTLLGLPNCVRLHDEIMAGSYRKERPRQFLLRDRGKVRVISPVTFRDRVVERVLCQRVLLPLTEPLMSFDNAASRVGKGAEFARARFRDAVGRAARERPGSYVLLYDFHDYFGSIPSARVMVALEERMYDLVESARERKLARRTLDLTRIFICEAAGLGLGNQTSQVAAIWWASPIDHHLACGLRVPCGRYMDDGWAILPDRASCVRALHELDALSRGLGLSLNRAKTQVLPVTGELPYLKGVFRAGETGAVSVRVASGALRRWRRHARAVTRLRDAGAVGDEALAASLASRAGVAGRCDATARRRLLGDLDAFAGALSALALALVLLLALAPAPALAEAASASGSTELTVIAPDAEPWVVVPVAPAFEGKADTWLRVAYVSGMEWELVRVFADGTRAPVAGCGWNGGAGARFEGLEPGATYLVRARQRESLEEAGLELAVTTFAAAAPPRIEATGAGVASPASAQGLAPSSAKAAWLRVADEGDAEGAVAAEGEAGKRYEWSLDGASWQADPLFSGLEPGASYRVYARVAGGTQVSEPTLVTLPAAREEAGDDPSAQPADHNRHAVLERGSDPSAQDTQAALLPRTDDLAYGLGALGASVAAGLLVILEAQLLRRWEARDE